jgi:hypothetical protein
VTAALLSLTPVVHGQQSVRTDDHVHSVDGRVLRPGDSGLLPVSGQWVVLHRLGSDGAGPIDSMRTDARGAYRFRYVRGGDERALYFAAAFYSGVAYFAPLMEHSVSGEAAEIVVFDTTTRDIPITVRGRHLVVSAADAGDRRTIMEIFELSNDTTVTRVSPAPESPPTWRTPLPAAALEPRVAAGDVPADAVTFDRGEVRIVAPLPPGVKQLAYSYTLPASVFPFSVPFTAAIDLLEVLLEDQQGSVSGARLEEVESVSVDGRRFRRFLAQDVPPGSVGVVEIPRMAAGVDPRFILGMLALAGGTMLLALARTLRRR